MFEGIIKTFLVLLVHFYVISIVAESIGQLPHCLDNSGQGLLIVSTLDGKLSALNSSGSLKWQIDTGPEPLLKSNIHNVELTNNGEWIRLIPSLTGGLYKFNGKTIDAIPISGDSLLKSSFFYSHDLVIAGGKEVKTYGVSLHSGNVIYTCSLLGCQNETNFEGEIDSVLIIERNTLTVRAHEPRTGNERWNFSVGHHNIKVPSVSCVNANNIIFSFNISAILPEGLLIASKVDNRNDVLWQYKFDVPIVNVWLWNGRDLTVVDTFDIPIMHDMKVDLSPDIYLAMHNKQLYIHESNKILNVLQSHTSPSEDMMESKSITKIPWKPIPASSATKKTNDHDRSAALSVLYNSEYVNGNGYFLYAENDIKNKDSLICSENNTTSNIFKNDSDSTIWSIQKNWAYAVITIIMVMSIYFLFGPKQLIIPAGKAVSSSVSTDSGRPVSSFYDEPDEKFISIYESSFDTVGCLGKGGFGVVFEAKQKIDECVYAIKRITLPVESECQVLREVKALAQLDHKNIVRYYNSWFEQPPITWSYEHDKKFIDDRFATMETNSCFTSEAEAVSEIKHKRNNSTVIDMSVISMGEADIPARSNSTSDFDISFRENSKSSQDKQENNDNTVSFKNKCDRDSKYSSSNTGTSHTSLSSNNYPNGYNVYCNKDRPIYLYIQMQLCKRENLKGWLLNNNSTRSKTIIIPMFKQILNAVEYIHSKGLIHRDLKPNNIFFSMDNEIKVGDFGLVTAMNENNDDLNTSITLLQSHTKGAGTELYMSPEQKEKKRYSYKVDIYSLGVIFFELLLPFSTEMERFKKLTDLRNDKYPADFLDKFPDEHRLLEKMLSKNPDVRPTTNEIKKTAPFTPTC